jgi:tetratricopeptide (TPR) repeat protein
MRLFVVVLLYTAQIQAAEPPLSSGDEEAAKAHFLAGSAYYEQANYIDAVREFNEAFRLSQRPDLLYNIALAYERLEKWDNAIYALKRYLRDKPDAQDRKTIQTRIDNMEKKKAAALAVAAPPPPALPPPAPAPKPRHVASLVVGSVGLGALVAAIGTGVSALQIKDDLEMVCRRQLCPTSQQAQSEKGYALAVSTDVLIGVGAAAVLVGVVLFVVESRRPQLRSRLDGLSVRF